MLANTNPFKVLAFAVFYGVVIFPLYFLWNAVLALGRFVTWPFRAIARRVSK